MRNFYFLAFFMVFATTEIYAQMETLSVQVTQSSDDAEESEDASETYLSSSDLELVFDDFSNQNNQTVGVRFQNISIPANATILNAYIQFYADDTGSGQTDLTIRGELTEFSQTFFNSFGNISSRNTTQGAVNWSNVPPWTVTHEGGIDQRTPDLSTLVGEMITSSGWTYGNPLTFIITGMGTREAESFDGTTAEAPTLVIDYTVPQAEFDLGITEVQGVDTYMYSQDNVFITTILKNCGLNPVDTFIVSYTLNNGTTVTDTVIQTISPNDSYIHTFSQPFDLISSGSYSIEVEVSTNNDNTVYNNVLEVEFQVVPEYSNIYFNTASVWKYLDDGSDLGTDWREINYDDSTWPLGAGQFGFGDGDEDTFVEEGNVTYYFRKIVDIENIENVSTIVANMLADDAAILYVNGQEVARAANLPQGAVSSSTPASRTSTQDFENYSLKYNIPVSYFNTGLNVIAVEVHNAAANNTDLSFSCEVIDQPIEYSVDGPYVIYNDTEILVKNITENGAVIDTFPLGVNPTLTCNLPNGDSFSFNLMETLEIPEPTYEMPDKFLVTSDIEGQIDAFIYLLQNADVIDENYNWTFGEGHLYFIGDMFDRGNFVTQCIWLLYKLEQEAQQAGGRVHFIVGNHEVMNFTQDFRYVQGKYYENAHYLDEMLDDMYNANTELGRWFRTKNIVENAGNSAILVHAGLSPNVWNLNLTYDQINDYGRLGMDDNCPSGNVACDIVNGGSDEGVYWYRGIAYGELAQIMVDNIISSFDGEQMIIGHTLFPQITPLYQQKVLAVDVDHGENYDDGYMEALYFEDHCYYRLIANAAGTTLTQINPDCEGTASIEPARLNTAAFNVHPTLFKDKLMIQYPDELLKGDILIYSATGALLKEFPLNVLSNNMTLNTVDWIPGVYMVSLQLEDQLISEKVIKY